VLPPLQLPLFQLDLRAHGQATLVHDVLNLAGSDIPMHPVSNLESVVEN
jgi:hypothetical protein